MPLNSSDPDELRAVSAATVRRLRFQANNGHTDWRWGVDIGERKLAVVALNANGQFTWRIRDPGQRTTSPDLAPELRILRRDAHELTTTLSERCAPLVVAIESPSGSFRNSRLESAFGVITEGIASALHEQFEAIPPFAKVSSGTWKKRCLGKGNASTDEYHAQAKQEFDLRANDNPDVSAAMWLACYAHTLTVRVQ